MKIKEDHLKPGTRILTTDKQRSKLLPGEILSSYVKNGQPTQDYYNVKLDNGEEVVLKYGTTATPVSFEVVHENKNRNSKMQKKTRSALLETKLRKMIREELMNEAEPESKFWREGWWSVVKYQGGSGWEIEKYMTEKAAKDVAAFLTKMDAYSTHTSRGERDKGKYNTKYIVKNER